MTLERLLESLVHSQDHTLNGLASELDVSPGLMEQMLHDLERGGYVHRIEAVCSERCESCPYRGRCGVTQGGRIWTLTEKGLRNVNA
ncbi:MAG: FeoC-like transcriptional regulator [Chloroflexota bacterium]|nr:FeoC-like transcriptional regulator [Chloroflexota bacterium]